MMGRVNSNQDSRQLLLNEFLKHTGISDLKLLPLADDCSFPEVLQGANQNE